MINSADPNQLVSEEAIWSGSTLFAKVEYIWVLQDKEETISLLCIYSPVSILHKSLAGRYRPVRVADGPIKARYRFM